MNRPRPAHNRGDKLNIRGIVFTWNGSRGEDWESHDRIAIRWLPQSGWVAEWWGESACQSVSTVQATEEAAVDALMESMRTDAGIYVRMVHEINATLAKLGRGEVSS